MNKIKWLDWWFNHYKVPVPKLRRWPSLSSVTKQDWTCWDTALFTSNRDSREHNRAINHMSSMYSTHRPTDTHTHTHTHTRGCSFHIAPTAFQRSVALWDSHTHTKEVRKGKKNRTLFKCHDILNMVLQQHASLSILEEKQNVHKTRRAPRHDSSFSCIYVWFISFYILFLLRLPPCKQSGQLAQS